MKKLLGGGAGQKWTGSATLATAESAKKGSSPQQKYQYYTQVPVPGGGGVELHGPPQGLLGRLRHRVRLV